MELLKTITDQNVTTEISESKLPVVIDFWSPGCGPCLIMKAYLSRVASEYLGKVNVFTVDASENQAVARKYMVMSVPTIILLMDGNEVYRFSGTKTAEQMRVAIDKMLLGEVT